VLKEREEETRPKRKEDRHSLTSASERSVVDRHGSTREPGLIIKKGNILQCAPGKKLLYEGRLEGGRIALNQGRDTRSALPPGMRGREKKTFRLR